MVRGAAYAQSYLARALTRLPPERRARLQPLLRSRETLVTGAPPASGLRLRDLQLAHVQAWGLVRGVVEPSVQEAIRRHAGPGRTMWDVGANVGFFSLLAARLGADVRAFEPVRENADALRANARANALEIEVDERAVGETTGRAAFLVVADPSWSHLADRGRHSATREQVDVEVVALDDVEGHPPDLVKIDVEGSEIAVLRGARRLLATARPVLVVELHETNAEVCDLLDEAGYEAENLDGPEHPRSAGAVHLLARPRRRSS